MKKIAFASLVFFTSLFFACSDDKSASTDTGTISIGGTLSGLASDSGAVTLSLLSSSGTESLYPSDNGAFSFAAKLIEGETYAVSVAVNPSDRVCTVANGSGAATGVNISNITVTCVPN